MPVAETRKVIDSPSERTKIRGEDVGSVSGDWLILAEITKATKKDAPHHTRQDAD
jgi:hypothetical protein